MARFSRLQVAQTLLDQGMMPLFYQADIELCKKITDACYAGGLRIIEFTNRGDLAHEVFTDLMKYVRTTYPDLILGIGSVVDGPTTALYIQLGADFVVSPILNHDMARICNRRKILWGPGCATLSEINQAEEWGAEIVKVFPANTLGGPAFIKSIKGPCPWSTLIATGGVEPTHENLSGWFGAGIDCVGMGSKLVSKDMIARNAFGELETVVRETLALIQDLRKKGE
ncbi:MAG: bifunctional 4-hydroxy-2-oxoglutarate aldolase/2-dehydro-3-deoxy-phosphogluconate aldolase [Bacteroidota bacterium]